MKVIIGSIVLLLFQFASAQKKVSTIVKQVPSVSIFNIKGESFNLPAFTSGKVTVIDCWFLPCAPCFVEMPMLHELYFKYRDNPAFQFLTITRTDSSLVKPLINNDATGNDVHNYFKTFSGLETFQLPVYFIPGCNEKLHNYGQSKIDFEGENIPPDNSKNCPDAIFKFVGFPTLLIFDKKGKLVYSKNGFLKSNEVQQKQEIEKIINANLTL